jgi:hypothetical protein
VARLIVDEYVLWLQEVIVREVADATLERIRRIADELEGLNKGEQSSNLAHDFAAIRAA